ncbi:MAG: GTP-binding protein [Oscillibacter sp.]|nr:GTP-binding protein [Oscillibacter sp.]
MTKIDIISGFLGAGKTTLIKKLLAEAFPGEQIVLIENEFGEISIDGGFLKESGVQISEMSSGCICCTLVGDFSKALVEVQEQFHPDRVLIEPSGVGKLSDVIVAVKGVDAPGMELNSYVTVADATKAKTYMKNFGEFYNNQVESAGTIVLSRTQKLSQEKLEAVVALLREKNPDAAILTTPWDELDGKTILSAMEKVSLADELLAKMRAEHEAEEAEHEAEHHHDHEHKHEHDHEHHHHHHHHADEVFTSWGKETPKVFSKAEIEKILSALDGGEYGKILRAKGIVNGENGQWLEFDYVPEESEIRDGHPDYTGRLCVIGAELDEPKLAALFGL